MRGSLDRRSDGRPSLWHAQQEVSLDEIAVYCGPEPAV